MKLSLTEWRAREGLLNEDAYEAELGRLVLDSVCPALCDEGCEVEPDGHCPHGCPSVLLAVGLVW